MEVPMAKRKMTVERLEEIKRLLALGVSLSDISRSVRCTRRTIRQIRDQGKGATDSGGKGEGPFWALQIDWEEVLRAVLSGHPLKWVWEERALEQVTYINFWKQFQKRFPAYKKKTVIHRFFAPGERCEVDYAGKKEGSKISWVDVRYGLVHEVDVFVGILGFSQLIFACARENAKMQNFLSCHEQMYADFTGVPKVSVPDCLKQGVLKCHLYDPDLNPTYADFARHYGTAIVPARPGHPQDKGLVEGAVKLVMRLFRFLYRNHTFVSLSEINEALRKVCERINEKEHTRFKTSRKKRFEESEKKALGPLPEIPYEFVQCKELTIHPDSYVALEGFYYSAPHIHRGKKVKVKYGEQRVEIFLGLERIALHQKAQPHADRYVTNPQHLPDNARAYHEATPQNLLSQAKYLSGDLHALIEELFSGDTLGHLRRVQGFIRQSRKAFEVFGEEKARSLIAKAVAMMRRYEKFRVPYFQDLLQRYSLEIAACAQPQSILRKPNNPFLRYSAPARNQEETQERNLWIPFSSTQN
jgi:hypothetical protein